MRTNKVLDLVTAGFQWLDALRSLGHGHGARKASHNQGGHIFRVKGLCETKLDILADPLGNRFSPSLKQPVEFLSGFNIKRGKLKRKIVQGATGYHFGIP